MVKFHYIELTRQLKVNNKYRQLKVVKYLDNLRLLSGYADI